MGQDVSIIRGKVTIDELESTLEQDSRLALERAEEWTLDDGGKVKRLYVERKRDGRRIIAHTHSNEKSIDWFRVPRGGEPLLLEMCNRFDLLLEDRSDRYRYGQNGLHGWSDDFGNGFVNPRPFCLME
jgi:hypothetical protein